MRFEIRLRIVADEGETISNEEVVILEKGQERIEAVGLSLSKSKTLLGHLSGASSRPRPPPMSTGIGAARPVAVPCGARDAIP